MRCSCCNCNLSDFESVLKHPETNEYLDTCLVCIEDTDITPVTTSRIPPSHGWDDELDYDDDYYEDDYEQDDRMEL